MNRFMESIVEQFGFTSTEAQKIYDVFVKANVLKIDKVNGSVMMKHGAFWDKEVMLRALEM